MQLEVNAQWARDTETTSHQCQCNVDATLYKHDVPPSLCKQNSTKEPLLDHKGGVLAIRSLRIR